MGPRGGVLRTGSPCPGHLTQERVVTMPAQLRGIPTVEGLRFTQNVQQPSREKAVSCRRWQAKVVFSSTADLRGNRLSHEEDVARAGHSIQDGQGGPETQGVQIHSRSGRRQVLSGGIGTLAVTAASFAGAAKGTEPLRASPGLLSMQEREKQTALDSALNSLRGRVSAFQLSNGMRWIVAERHKAPIVACHTFADVGAADEADGSTGVAHLLEHLAFKGTSQIGTRNVEAEAALLDILDEIFYTRRDALQRGDTAQVTKLTEQFERVQSQAAELAIPNEYGALLAREGAVGLNAQTSQDSTEYYVSLPSNKLELWMAAESARFRAPVFRGLYSEKEVVKEERRLRVDNSPLGKFIEAFAETAFPGYSYGRPVIGYPDDFEKIGRREVEDFFRQRYTPRALVCAVVGDVSPSQVQKMAEKYFGGWKSQGLPAAAEPQWRVDAGWDGLLRTDQPRSFRMALTAQPFYMEGYYRPSAASTDDPAISVLSALLSGSRSSRFYKNLVTPGKVLSASASESYPGDKRPNLLILSGIPSRGSDTDAIAKLLHGQLEALAATAVQEAELLPVKKAARAGLLEIFGTSTGLAKLLCQFEAQTGSWEGLLGESDALEAVTPADVQRVASLLYDDKNRVSGHVRTRVPILPFTPALPKVG